ncbi:MAG: hypothetical protein DMG57_13995 [Acidobacteria bacterium]|nr:MAG: hypothetical protein DMG57_13995 [Acidobacteriota bacterium]
MIDRAFDQFADLENLPQLAAILCRQVTKDLSLVGGDIGNRRGCTSWLYGQSKHRVKLTWPRYTFTVHDFFLNVLELTELTGQLCLHLGCQRKRS